MDLGRRCRARRGLSLSLSLSLSLCGSRSAAAVDPLKLIRPTALYTPLEGDDASPAPRGEIRPPADGRTRVQLAYWSTPAYAGPLSGKAVETLVAAGRADTLQFHLNESERKSLEQELSDLDAAMRDVSIAIAAQEDLVEAKLEEDPERRIILRADPPSSDPRFPELMRLQRSMPYDVGVVWGDVHPEGEVHVIVRWEEWPGLKALYDDRFAVIKERRRRAREWVAARFATSGMEIFGSR